MQIVLNVQMNWLVLTTLPAKLAQFLKHLDEIAIEPSKVFFAVCGSIKLLDFLTMTSLDLPLFSNVRRSRARDVMSDLHLQVNAA